MSKRNQLLNTALFRYEMPDKQQRHFIAMDMETMPISDSLSVNDFIYGAAYRSDDPEKEITYFGTIAAMIEYMMDRDNEGYIIYFHNGANFDFKFLIPELKKIKEENEKFSFEMVMQGQSRCIALILRMGKRRVEIRDSFALIPSSLKELSAKFAPEYEKKNIGLGDGVIFNPNDPEHLEYLKYDVLSLVKVIIAFREIVEDYFTVHLGRTTAATAMRALRATLPPGHVHFRQRHSVEDMAYAAYYGGRIYLRDTEFHEDVTAWDVNSMYPTVMRKNGVPTGPAAYTTEYLPDYPGIYEVIADVPKSFTFPIVPERHKGGTRFSTGVFYTFITSMEMEVAMRYGCTFKVLSGYVWMQSEHIFDEFVDKCERLRLQFKGTAVEVATKLIANSAYGKFGTKRIVESYYIMEPTIQEILEKQLTPYVAPDGSVSEDIWIQRKPLDAAYIMPHWAAWITAGARVYLFELAEKIGLENVLYTDTDSLFCTRVHGDKLSHMTGNNFGQVKLDKEMSTFIAGGLKVYAGKTEVSKKYPTGEIVCCKGMPIKIFGKPFTTYDDIVRAAHGEKVKKRFVRSNSTKAVVQREKAYFEQMERALSDITKSHNLRMDGKRVLPIHHEFLELPENWYQIP